MNLIICTTPLQVVIAERIIEKYPEEEFIGVMLVSSSNNKQKYYYEKLSKVTRSSYWFNLEKYKGRLRYLIFFIYCRYFLFSNKRFSRVFLSSIDSVCLQAMISGQNQEEIEIFTFDDGSANIHKDSMFYIEPQTRLGKVAYRCLGNKYSITKIKEKSFLHYTIYEGFDNIIENTEFIPLFKCNAVQEVDNDKECISIFLGQPIFDIDELNIKYISSAVEKLGIDFYFPHPREKFKIDNVEYIETNLIFEEYLINEMLLNNASCKYKIYTFFSSGILNLVGLRENIEVIAVKFNEIPEKYSGVYSLFLQNGIKILDISKEME